MSAVVLLGGVLPCAVVVAAIEIGGWITRRLP